MNIESKKGIVDLETHFYTTSKKNYLQNGLAYRLTVI